MTIHSDLDVTLHTDYTDGFDVNKVTGWDTETAWDPDDPGLTPPPVCLTLAGFFGTVEFAAWLEQQGALVLWDGLKWRALVDSTMDMAGIFRAFVQASDIAVAHNLAYDFAIAETAGWMPHGPLADRVEHGVLRDTMVREKLYCIATDNFNFDSRLDGTKTKFSLARLAEVYLKKDRYADKGPDTWREKYRLLLGVPWREWPQEALDYAIEDAEDARDVFVAQCQPRSIPEGTIVTSAGNVVNERAQTQAAVSLHYMAMHPPAAAPDRVSVFATQVQVGVDAAQAAGTRVGIYRVNKCKACEGTGFLGSVPSLRPCTTCHGDPAYLPPRARVPKGDPTLHKARLQAWVRHALGEFTPMTDPTEKFPQGQVKTDTDTVKSTAIPDLVAWARGQEDQKLLSTYVPILQRENILSRPNVLVRSGRTSWGDPNWQNPPRAEGFRECFIARPGMVYASVDYKAVEMVTLAQTCLDWFGESKMADAINRGEDLHLLFAAWMLRITYNEAKDRLKAGDKEVKKARQEAKIANFGFPGGLGATTFVEYAAGFGVEISLNRAHELKEMWLEAWPEMELYFRRISEMADRGLPDKFGKQRFPLRQEPTGRIRGGCHFTSACNTNFQGRAADLAKAAMWALHRACYIDQTSLLFGVRIWAFVHDEFLLEGPVLTAHLWADEVVRLMQEAGQPFVPDVQLEAVPALSYAWGKAPDTERVGGTEDEPGDLVPWEPREAARLAASLPALEASSDPDDWKKATTVRDKLRDLLDIIHRHEPGWTPEGE